MTASSSVRRVGGALFCLVNLWAALIWALGVARVYERGGLSLALSIAAVLFFGYLALAFGDYAATGSRPWPIPTRS